MIDLQLNGYKGVDFNADEVPTEDIRRACQAFRADGGGRMLATVITDSLPRMAARIARLAAAHRDDAVIRDVMAGIHVEGPFISPSPATWEPTRCGTSSPGPWRRPNRSSRRGLGS